MNLLGKLSVNTLLYKLGLTGSAAPRKETTAKEALDEIIGEEITLERIKDLIIEAYSVLDDNTKMLLLQRADRLEAQLVQAYRAKGLKITADNICTTLEDHRRRCTNL